MGNHKYIVTHIIQLQNPGVVSNGQVCPLPITMVILELSDQSTLTNTNTNTNEEKKQVTDDGEVAL